MIKIMSLSLFIIIGLFCSQSNASQKTIKLNPNETKSLANNTLWTLNATCVVQSTHLNKSKIKINVVKNCGSVNGKKLSTGQGTLIKVKNNSSVSVTAEPGTQINLINLGTDDLQAVCST
ncbi:hypothetical protein Lste_1141 [Legionella steelei]|uniref:Transmembrane protein n=2 Tax=Legionella steelei TaxID=947033 RepID=A0A0W0ZFM2_9GAMM|nr:hypothetical protein Lste_1141 [Legionella steelei]